MKPSPQHPQGQNESQNCYSIDDALPFKLKNLYLLIYFRKETINPKKKTENTFFFILKETQHYIVFHENT